MTDPFRPLDEEARATASELMADMRHAVLAYTDTSRNAPSSSRIATLALPNFGVVTLVSELSLHTPALRSGNPCALLIGNVPEKGDPLTAPRLTLHAHPEPADKKLLREPWLARLPKSALYYDFTDFIAFRLRPRDAFLNGGFGKAYLFDADDLDF